MCIGGGAVGAEAEITASVPAGAHCPKVCSCGMRDLTGPGWDLAWFHCPGSGAWLRSLLLLLKVYVYLVLQYYHININIMLLFCYLLDGDRFFYLY